MRELELKGSEAQLKYSTDFGDLLCIYLLWQAIGTSLLGPANWEGVCLMQPSNLARNLMGGQFAGHCEQPPKRAMTILVESSELKLHNFRKQDRPPSKVITLFPQLLVCSVYVQLC